MLYLIVEHIDPRKTMEGRRKRGRSFMNSDAELYQEWLDKGAHDIEVAQFLSKADTLLVNHGATPVKRLVVPVNA